MCGALVGGFSEGKAWPASAATGLQQVPQGSADCWGRGSVPSSLDECPGPAIFQSFLSFLLLAALGRQVNREGRAENTGIGDLRVPSHSDPYCPPCALQQGPDLELTNYVTWDKSLDLSELLCGER